LDGALVDGVYGVASEVLLARLVFHGESGGGSFYDQFSVRPPLLVTVGPLDGRSILTVQCPENAPLPGAIGQDGHDRSDAAGFVRHDC